MPLDDDSRIERLVVERGLATSTEVKRLRAERPPEDGRSLLDILRDTRVLTPAQATEVRETVRRAAQDADSSASRTADEIPLSLRHLIERGGESAIPPNLNFGATADDDTTPDALPADPDSTSGASRSQSGEAGGLPIDEQTETGVPDFDADDSGLDELADSVRELRNTIEPSPGDVIANCEIEAEIGVGGFATVYRAVHGMVGRTVAIKIFDADMRDVSAGSPTTPSAGDPSLAPARFLEEARATAALDHPSIVRVLDVGVDAGRPFLVMEYVDGQDLRARVRDHGPMDPADVAYVGAEIAKALAVAHEAGIIHRDVKPDNVLVSDGYVKVTDFGLARATRSAGGGSREADVSQQPMGMLGSPHFMAPEQARKSEVADETSDLYSLGATLYFLVTGEPPFDGPNPYAILLQHESQPLTPPRKRGPEVPEELEEIIVALLAKNPAARPESAWAALEMLIKTGLPDRAPLASFGHVSPLPPSSAGLGSLGHVSTTHRFHQPAPPVSGVTDASGRPPTSRVIVRQPGRSGRLAAGSPLVLPPHAMPDDDPTRLRNEPTNPPAEPDPSAPTRLEAALPWLLGGLILAVGVALILVLAGVL